MTNILAREIKTYKETLPSLIKKAQGQFVLIHGEEILGIFESEQAGIQAGYQELGNTPFLVKEILEQDRIAIIG
jgi:hypothetical protein